MAVSSRVPVDHKDGVKNWDLGLESFGTFILPSPSSVVNPKVLCFFFFLPLLHHTLPFFGNSGNIFHPFIGIRESMFNISKKSYISKMDKDKLKVQMEEMWAEQLHHMEPTESRYITKFHESKPDNTPIKESSMQEGLTLSTSAPLILASTNTGKKGVSFPARSWNLVYVEQKNISALKILKKKKEERRSFYNWMVMLLIGFCGLKSN